MVHGMHPVTTGPKTERRIAPRVFSAVGADATNLCSMTDVDERVVSLVCGRLSRPDAAALFAPAGPAKIEAAERDYAEGVIEGRDLKSRRDALQPSWRP
jgi:hypothetical protein